jgi:uncharacterized protein
MSDALLDLFTHQFIEAQTQPQVLFTWHGGEPLLRPLSFYKRALELQRRYAGGRQIDNCLQTNGTLLTDEWCEFLSENGFLVGLSIDGPEALHNAYRERSFHRVMRAVSLLNKHGVQWNAMATVNAVNVEHPTAFYRFFRSLDCQFLQFTPVVERTTDRTDGLTLASPAQHEAQLTDFSVTPGQWGSFLCSVYDEWVRHDVGQVFVQLFDSTLANWTDEPSGLCAMSPVCGRSAALEANGDVYSCDHFVFPEYRLGNIRNQSLTTLLYSERQQQFGHSKLSALPRQCRECRFLFACYGECPRNRFVTDKYGQPGLNYLCQGYYRFFCHIAADMDFMKAELDAGRPPANVMRRYMPAPVRESK